MTTTPRTSPIRQSLLQRWAITRADLRRSRQARHAHRQLVADLATYTTNAEVDDLLATIQGRDDASHAEIRAVLVRNLGHSARLAGIPR